MCFFGRYAEFMILGKTHVLPPIDYVNYLVCSLVRRLIDRSYRLGDIVAASDRWIFVTIPPNCISDHFYVIV